MVRAREQVTGCKPVLIEQLPKRTAHASEIRTGDPDFSAVADVLSANQRLQMQFHAVGQSVNVVSAFQHAHQSAICVSGRNLHDQFRQFCKILCLQPQRADGVFDVSIKAGTDDHEFRPALICGNRQRIFEGSEIVFSGSAKTHGQVEHRSQARSTTGFTFRPEPG